MATDLEARAIPHSVLPCDPDLADTAHFCKAYDIPLERSANAILIASKRPQGHVALCVALANTRLDVNHRVRELMGVKKLSFANAEATIEHTGMEIGGVTPFGIPEGLPVYVDSAVLDNDWVILGGGNRSTKLRIDPAVMRGLDGFEVVDGLATVHA